MHLKKSLAFFSFLIFGLALQLSAQDYSLSSEYNLGRVVGGPVLENTLVPIENTYASTDFLLFQNGVEGHINAGFFLASLLGSEYRGEGFNYLFALPLIYLQSEPISSLRLKLTFEPGNFAFGELDGTFINGFDQSFIFRNTYSLDYLSNDGEITIDRESFDQVFYNAPLLNQNQFRSTLLFSHFIGDMGFKISKLNALLSYGILNHVQLGLGMEFSNLDYSGNVSLIDEWIYNTTYTYPLHDEFIFSGKASVLLGPVAGELAYSNADGGNRISLNSSFITSSDIPCPEGNWDHFFDNHLAKGQFESNLSLLYKDYVDRYYTDYEWADVIYIKEEKNDLNLGISAGYGVLDFLTLSSSFSTDNFENFGVYLHALSMNIPRRDYGPAEASAFEYTFGLKPRAGQYRAEVWYRLPIDNGLYFAASRPTVNRLPSVNLNSNLGSDLDISFSYGITDWFILEDEFKLLIGDRSFAGNDNSLYNSTSLSFLTRDKFRLGVGFSLMNVPYTDDMHYQWDGNLQLVF